MCPLSTNVLHVAAFAPEQSGNFVASLRDLDRRAREAGIRCRFLFPHAASTRSWYAQLLDAGHEATYLPQSASTISHLRTIRAAIRAFDADILHTHFGSYDAVSWLAARTLNPRQRRPEIVWHVHSDLNRGAGMLRRTSDCLRWRGLAREVHVICVADHLREQLVTRGVDQDRVRVILNCVDTERARQSGVGPDTTRAALKIGPNRRVFVLYGWDPDRKGVDLALAALEKVVYRAPEVVLAAIGGERLEKYLDDRFGTDKPPWLRVLPTTPHPSDYYRMGLAFVAPSRREGMPYSILEAMANGVPVLVSHIPAHLPIREAAGVLSFPPDDAGALATVIEEILDWPDATRIERGRANRRFVEEHLSVDRWSTRVLALYRQILE